MDFLIEIRLIKIIAHFEMRLVTGSKYSILIEEKILTKFQKLKILKNPGEKSSGELS